MLDTIQGLPHCSNIVDLPISAVLPADAPPRTAGLNTGHIRMLADSATALPPIVVHRATMQVVDGWHRLRAAELRGDTSIAAVLFDGGLAEAFVLAVKLNAAHGLPLSLADRKAAALRILQSYPDWSDRSIGAITGISHKTVGAIRTRSTGKSTQSTGRIARNGVLHRSAGRQGRQRAAELFALDPTASTRKVASAAGISVTTAKDVRRRLRDGTQLVSACESAGATAAPGPVPAPVPSAGATAAPVPVPAPVPTPVRAGNVRAVPSQPVSTAEALQRLRKDPSIRFSESGRKLLRRLETPFDDGVDWKSVVGSLPNHCTRTIAELARQRSREWQRLAHLLDERSSAG
ncbi:ParB/RepB/Spo0J family partition protein [Nocardia sp. XZ_19_369]|uniref:ParB/RepB/Spo0J family partition protein n=1 Tax=Nocardia sp. XZ_19_369 TaxID=2769487 RepID=UPI0018904953|nr:ParB/RepB/Spo0J family partition protein [Nocardia sp. XZ_19_369]